MTIDPTTVQVGTEVEVEIDTTIRGATCITCGQLWEKAPRFEWARGHVESITTVETAAGTSRDMIKVSFGPRGWPAEHGRTISVTRHVSTIKLRTVDVPRDITEGR
jgi:hypothetical protein